ncbi:hypothetical protein IZU94_16325 [Legionella sp. 27fs60]|uniref:Bile acid beta-glucosidase n=2 Tax=Legionella bononiensis TaxID=2793102 RepID=A0ABS1WB86_9GAMM|nr:hypothetical protein [Legionella bononiensis]MBL7526603.1 hypothetical protein [Legionella bononiensis]
MIPDLNNLLNYKNDRLIARYNRDFPQSKMDADDALTELMKFIWLCHKHQSDRTDYPHQSSYNFNCVIHAEMDDIDNMWHTFLLFTRDYHRFCQDYLDGSFFHHEPMDNQDDVILEDYELELSRYLSYIYDHLGESTLIKWFNP